MAGGDGGPACTPQELDPDRYIPGRPAGGGVEHMG
jgi:hypothetical protein